MGERWGGVVSEFTETRLVYLTDVDKDEATKHDSGKDPWHLAPFDAFRAIVAVLRFGAHKYAPRDWEKGMKW